jgi:hypothetical protein
MRLNIAAVVLHHTRKMAADDLMETVSGTFGQTGAADTVIVLARKGGGAVMDIRGRDVESNELAIAFGKETCRWTILGNAAEVHQTDQRKRVIAALIEHGQPMSIADLMAATGMRRTALDPLLSRMLSDPTPQIKRIKQGVYAHKDWTEPTPTEPPPTKRRSNLARLARLARKQKISTPKQMAERKGETSAILQSFASCTDLPGSAAAPPATSAEPAKTAQDAQDRKISAQVTETSGSSDAHNLSVALQDAQDSGKRSDDDVSPIPPAPPDLRYHLNQRGEVCAHCGQPGDLHDCA